MIWKYKVVTLQEGTTKLNLQDLLNNNDRAGLEFVSAVVLGKFTYGIFKKKVRVWYYEVEILKEGTTQQNLQNLLHDYDRAELEFVSVLVLGKVTYGIFRKKD